VSTSLLDVNMLVALTWPSHVHFEPANEWFARHAHAGWATCPMTQCAFVRLSSNPTIFPDAVEPLEALAMLRAWTAHESHEFWPDTPALYDDVMPTGMLAGHRQVSDAYLLGLAISRGGRLVTLDRGLEALLPAGPEQRDMLTVVPV